MADVNESGYEFTYQYRGCAVIIVNKNFWKYENKKKKIVPDMKRKGSTVDLRKMIQMFTDLDFKVKRYKDLTAKGMIEKITKASQSEMNQKSDCFALVISSHGEELEEKKVKGLPKDAHLWRHSVSGSDCNHVYIDEMMDLFKDDEAKGLAGKPKLFFIQACRSRHGPKTLRFDYGIEASVAIGGGGGGPPGGDSGDHGDGGSSEITEGFDDIEDANADWNDLDDEEWHSDVETDSSDDDGFIDSDTDILDAKGEQDSGMMPQSPDNELPTPTLPLPRTEPAKVPEIRREEQETNGNVQHTAGDPNVGVVSSSLEKPFGKLSLQTPREHSVKSPCPSQDKEVTTTPADKLDVEGVQVSDVAPPSPGDEPDVNVRHSKDTDIMPPSPFDIVPIKCPDDCVLVYPVMPGYVAFRRAVIGSRLLHCMQKKENLSHLVKGCDFLQYMTIICGDMARVLIKFEPSVDEYTPQEIQELKANMPFKVSTTVVHRLRGKVVFEPKTKKSFMSALLRKFRK